jgi:predicted deacylase
MSDLTDVFSSSAAPAEMPSLAPYRGGNTGIPYVLSFAAARPGPHVLITAIVHGNEICGAIALDRLLQAGLRPARGRLTLAFANVEAYLRRDGGAPAPSRYVEEDLNRVWSPALLEGKCRSAELRRARELRPAVDSADFLLDLHSMQHGEEPILLSGPLEKGRRLALDLGYPTVVVSDAGHVSGTRLRDYGPFGDPAQPQNATLVECGPHDSPLSAEVAFETTLRFLLRTGTIRPDAAELRRLSAGGKSRLIIVTQAVTASSPRFRFTARFSGLERISKAGTVIAHDGEQPIATPYDDCVLIMPAERCQPGQTAVRLGRVGP